MRFALGGSVYDWNDPFVRMFLQILAVIAEFEANLIRQRTREDMDIGPPRFPAPGRTCPEPDVAKYDQLLTSTQKAETRKP